MIRFHLKPFDEVSNPKLKFYKLYEDGVCYYDRFVEELDRKYKSLKKELPKIYALMDALGNMNLPTTKFRYIHPNHKGDREDVWEFKTAHLRVYVIKQEPDVYIVLGGYKNEQDANIEKVFKHFNNLPDELEIEQYKII